MRESAKIWIKTDKGGVQPPFTLFNITYSWYHMILFEQYHFFHLLKSPGLDAVDINTA